MSRQEKPPVNTTSERCTNWDGCRDEEVTSTRYSQALCLVGGAWSYSLPDAGEPTGQTKRIKLPSLLVVS